MQDNYVGDIGDYGKYGLLRMLCSRGMTLSVNWYKVVPKQKGKQEDGKYTNYLSDSLKYRCYDPCLFDEIHQIVCVEQDRKTERIEQARLFPAQFYAQPLMGNRDIWHQQALFETMGTETVFLDPDNGLETQAMFYSNKATEKHVKWTELRDYYTRGQNVILYQHRPQMTTKDACIEQVMKFQKDALQADSVLLLEFPKYTNRFYFIFAHKESVPVFEQICEEMADVWGKDGFCRRVEI